MRLKLRNFTKIAINSETVFMISFIMFFSLDLWVSVFRSVLRFVGLESYAFIFTIVVIYLPLLLVSLASNKIYAHEFFILLFILIFLFIITYLIHPDYEEWYTRDNYGVWDYVLRPDNGIYVFLFFMLI